MRFIIWLAGVFSFTILIIWPMVSSAQELGELTLQERIHRAGIGYYQGEALTEAGYSFSVYTTELNGCEIRTSQFLFHNSVPDFTQFYRTYVDIRTLDTSNLIIKNILDESGNYKLVTMKILPEFTAEFEDALQQRSVLQVEMAESYLSNLTEGTAMIRGNIARKLARYNLPGRILSGDAGDYIMRNFAMTTMGDSGEINISALDRAELLVKSEWVIDILAALDELGKTECSPG